MSGIQDELNKDTIVIDIRHNFGFIFSQLSMINKVRYGKPLLEKLEEQIDAVEKLHEDGYLNDYLHENLLDVLDFYPVVSSDELLKKEKEEKLSHLNESLLDLIGELSTELKDIIKR